AVLLPHRGGDLVGPGVAPQGLRHQPVQVTRLLPDVVAQEVPPLLVQDQTRDAPVHRPAGHHEVARLTEEGAVGFLLLAVSGRAPPEALRLHPQPVQAVEHHRAHLLVSLAEGEVHAAAVLAADRGPLAVPDALLLLEPLPDVEVTKPASIEGDLEY